MAAPRRPCGIVNNSAYVAPQPRGPLAVRRGTDHSGPEPCRTSIAPREECIRTPQQPPAPATALILEDFPMTDAVKVGFVPFSAPARGTLVAFCDDRLEFGPATEKVLGDAIGLVKRAAETNQFKGKSAAALDILAPEGLKAKRLIVMGVGKLVAIKETDFLRRGAGPAGKLAAGNGPVTVVAELPGGAINPAQAAAIASGIRLRAYKFDRYKTKKKEGEEGTLHADVSLAVDNTSAARKAFAPNAQIIDGVIVARELVNEPPNVLFPVEFARRAKQVRKLG